jgi:hypothetical protein
MDNNKSFVGLGNIVLSEVDGTIYINTNSQIRPSIRGALSFYDKDNESLLIGTGKDLFWNVEGSRLETTALKAVDVESKELKVETYADINELNANTLLCDFLKIKTHVEAETINAKYLACDFLEVIDRLDSNQLSGKKWIGLESRISVNTHPFKYQLTLDDDGSEVLILKTNDYSSDHKSRVVIAFESERVIIPETLNIFSKTIEDPVGSEKDRQGDLSIDDRFIYYCTKDYDGTSRIWRRSTLESW